jgi:Zn-dependent peptidase ImmA (M78 family)
MDRRSIELEARNLLGRIWRSQEELFPLGAPQPLHMLEPEIAARLLGYQLEYADGLGRWRRGSADFEIAGLLDQQRHLIRVSTKFAYPTMRFTAAHELGHVVLRHPGHVIHRDRPVFDVQQGNSRDPQEQEADYFAACLLAPARLLTDEFKKRFGIGPPLPLNDDVAFNLCGESAHALMRAGPDSLKFAAMVASTRRFNGRHFQSLAEMFNISVSAMAIRLQELHLVED